MELLFTTILYINVVMMVISFIFAYILLRRAKGDKIYFNFGMSTLFLGLWILSIVLLFFEVIKLDGVFFTNLSFLFGIWILHYFLIFTMKYPVPGSNDRLKINLLYLLTILLSVSIFLPGVYAVESTLDFPFLHVEINPVGLSIFSLYFFILSLLSFINLFKKYFQSDGIFRVHLRKIIIGTLIAVFVNFIFGITIYFFVNFDTTPIGILFVFGVLMYIYSILFSKKPV